MIIVVQTKVSRRVNLLFEYLFMKHRLDSRKFNNILYDKNHTLNIIL